MGIPSCVICCFSLAAFNILFFSLVFAILIIVCFGEFLFGLILYGNLSASQAWVTVSFPRLGKFSAIMSSNMFSSPLLSLLFLGPLHCKYQCAWCCPSSLLNSPHFISFFSFFSFRPQRFPLFFQLSDPFFCNIQSVVDSFQYIFLVIYCALYLILAVLGISVSLFKISNFSLCASISLLSSLISL